jgi:hypothetical protein
MNIAVIIETRKNYPLDFIIQEHMKHLPNWELDVITDIPIKSLTQYNQLLTTPSFWEKYQDYERVLIFQTDSMILRDGIDEFLEWDYVGAPWKFQDKGGNGGFSLRNPKKCLSLIQKREWNISYGYEDVFYSNHLHEVGGLVAPRNVCSKFSCETIFQLGTFGIHAIESWLTPQQVQQIKTQYE